MSMKTSLSQDSLIIQVDPYVEDNKHEDFVTPLLEFVISYAI